VYSACVVSGKSMYVISSSVVETMLDMGAIKLSAPNIAIDSADNCKSLSQASLIRTETRATLTCRAHCL
jgi:hypothetical protein